MSSGILEPIGTGDDAFMVERQKIPPLFNDSFWKAVQIWQRWRRFGMPWHDVGWAEMPIHLISIIELFDKYFHEFENKPHDEQKLPTRKVTMR